VTGELIDIEPVDIRPLAHVVGGKTKVVDDYWGGNRSVIHIDDAFPTTCTTGLEAFSHLEVVFLFHLEPHDEYDPRPRSPRNNPDWPQVGIFGHRNMARPNRIGVSRCRLIEVDGLDLHVEELDAIDGTPVLDIKPWFPIFGPRGEVRVPAWPGEMLAEYFALPGGE
jgi:tRNA-Thr(GGU) m(6)t(6)A37 methyltransferase TsaA